MTVLSGLDPDPHWNVRAALATVLGTLPPEIALPRLQAMLNDTDQRVIPSVLAALVKLKAPTAAAVAARAPEGGRSGGARGGGGRASASSSRPAARPRSPTPTASASATRRYGARAAALAALAQVRRGGGARRCCRSAFADKDWAVRVRAAQLLKQLDPAAAADADAQIRPAPTTVAADVYRRPRLVDAGGVDRRSTSTPIAGTIQIELAVARRAADGRELHHAGAQGLLQRPAASTASCPTSSMQDGDPRGDGEGGPGYTIRDELNERPYLRGTVGMALDPWPDTGGSQFFITHSPQPHLDGEVHGLRPRRRRAWRSSTRFSSGT